MTQYDLNLVYALDVLLEEQSVSRAAERLHLSVPATSRLLGRVRAAFGDPILVRAGRRLVPTGYALSIKDEVHRLAEETRDLFQTGQCVSPGSLQRRFTIRANEGLAAQFAPGLLSHLSAEAPGVCLSFVSEGDEEIAPLRDGRIDMDLGRNTDLAPELSRLDLYQETVVGLLAPDNPLAGQNMTLERLATLPHVSVSRRGEPRGPLDDVLARAGLSRRVVVVVPSFAAAVLVVLSTEATCLLPRSMINELAQTTGALAYEVPTELGVAPVSLVWHTRFDSDPAHRWLRQVFSEVAGRFRAKTDAAKTAE